MAKDEKPSKQEQGVKKLINQIKLAEKWKEKWKQQADRIFKRYANEPSLQDEQAIAREDRGGSSFNILWANVQTLGPAIYSRLPKPSVQRRWKDSDPVGRLGAELLERGSAYSMGMDDLDTVFRQNRDDYLIIGQGQCWNRYTAEFEDAFERIPLMAQQDGAFVMEDGTILPQKAFGSIKQDDQGFYMDGAPYEKVVNEQVVTDYVHPHDFLYNPSRYWAEVTWVARKVYMTREELITRFGDKGKKVPLNYLPDNLKYDSNLRQEDSEAFKKACIYEVWKKDTKTVCWVNTDWREEYLDEKDDLLNLRGYFPCPKPLFGTLTNNKLLPIADYTLYQDQAEELDDVVARSSMLTDALKVAGVYDSACGGLQQLLSEGIENMLIPIDNWPMFAAGNGFNGAVAFMPLGDVINAIQVLEQKKVTLKNEIYELTGMSDIIRGISDPRETATAQQIKGQFATTRITDRQYDMQRYCRDVVAMRAEIICQKFSPETILEIGGAEFMDDKDAQPNMGAAVQLLKDDKLLTFRVDIETDSTINLDETIDRDARNEFLTSVSTFITNATQAAAMNPLAGPVLAEALMFGVRGYKVGSSLEASIQQFSDQAQKMAKDAIDNPKPPTPDPKMMEVQMKGQIEQMKLQLESSKHQFDQWYQQQELMIKNATIQSNEKVALTKIERESTLKAAELSANTQLTQQKLIVDTHLEEQKIAVDKGKSDYVAFDKGSKTLKAQRPAPRRRVTVEHDPQGRKTYIMEEDHSPKKPKAGAAA